MRTFSRLHFTFPALMFSFLSHYDNSPLDCQKLYDKFACVSYGWSTSEPDLKFFSLCAEAENNAH